MQQKQFGLFTNNVPPMTNQDEKDEIEHERNKSNRETTPAQETASRTKKFATNKQTQEEDFSTASNRPLSTSTDSRCPIREIGCCKKQRGQIAKIAGEKTESKRSIGYVRRRSTHDELVKRIQSNFIKYINIHQNIFDDQIIKDIILNRALDLTTYQM